MPETDHFLNKLLTGLCRIVSRVRSLLLVLSLIPLAVSGQVGGDYLTGDLRGRVEALKKSLDEPSPAADFESLRSRAALLWRWANRYAMGGNSIPHELTSVLARILTLSLQDATPQRLAALNRSVDQYLFEMKLLDERPGALGRLSAVTTGPFTAGSYREIRQIYTLGSELMTVGGGFLLAKHWLFTPRLQADTAAADNFVSLRSSRSNVKFASSSVPRGGIHGGLRRAEALIFFEIVEGTLYPDDRIEFIYGDQEQGSQGLKLPTSGNDGFVLPVYIRLFEASPYLSLPLLPLRITGGQVAAVRGFAPSIVMPGETFNIVVSSEDEFGNRASGRMPSYEVLLNGAFYARVPAGYGPSSTLQGMQFNEPGSYHFTFRSSGGGVKGVVNPVKVVANPHSRIYWGDLHGHTQMTDGQGSAESNLRYGKEDARLDFLSLPEHDQWLDDWEWGTLASDVERHYQEDVFVPLLGYEWTMPIEKGGHQTVIFRRPSGRDRFPKQTTSRLSDLYAQLRAGNSSEDVIVIPHGQAPGDWRYADPKLLSLVEIQSEQGFFEWFGNYYARHGNRVGFVAASDSHTAHPGNSPNGGLTAVLAARKTGDGLFDALKSRSTYATSGERIILDFRVNNGSMGSRIPSSERRIIQGEVVGSAPIDVISLFKNGSLLWEKTYSRPQELTESGAYLKLTFFSDSAPFMGQQDLPRQGRQWLGYLGVSEGELLSISYGGNFNTVRINPANRQRADFLLHTRGNQRGFVTELSSSADDLIFDISIKEGHEDELELPRTRLPAVTPSVRQRISLDELKRGDVVRDVNVQGYTDQITLRLINPDAALTQKFEYVDVREIREADYYYVRVKQIDDEYAWSSPIWVGGFDSR